MSADRLSTGKTKARRAPLVADDKMMLVVLTDMLHDLGVTGVVTAGNGIAGIGAYDRVSPPPEIVVRDLHMPLRSPS